MKRLNLKGKLLKFFKSYSLIQVQRRRAVGKLRNHWEVITVISNVKMFAIFRTSATEIC